MAQNSRKGDLNLEEVIVLIGGLVLVLLGMYFIFKEESSFLNWAKNIISILSDFISCSKDPAANIWDCFNALWTNIKIWLRIPIL